MTNPDLDSTQKMQFRTSFGFIFELAISIFVLPLSTATRKHENSEGHSLNVTPPKPHIFGLYTTSKQSHIKVESKNDVQE